MENDESKAKKEEVDNTKNNNKQVIENLDEKNFNSCLSLKNPIQENSDLPDLKKFNSEGMSSDKKFKNILVNNRNLRDENIFFKGENGNQEIFEIKLDKEQQLKIPDSNSL